MSSPAAAAPEISYELSAAPAKPAHVKELTPRAIGAGLLVAAIIGGSYPYVVMKLGFGPNISVVSAFFGYLALGIAFKDYNRWENNIVQTMGTCAGQTAFLCVLMAAFDLLGQAGIGFEMTLTGWQSFAWLTTAGILGVLLAVPMRQHFVVDEKLTYADGVAAAETLIVLDSRGKEAKHAARSMGAGTVVSGLVMVLREDARLIGEAWYRIPEMLALGANGASMAFGMGWSLLSIGSGMLVGLRINASMLLGTMISWCWAPPMLVEHGVIEALVRKKVLLWVMWPATGLLVAGGLAALFLKWRVMARTFQSFSGSKIHSSDFPMSWVAIGAAASAVALILVQKFMLGMPVWMTLAAMAFTLPLMLVGLRVLGETNWGPISALSNMMQAIFGIIAPGQIGPNMIASGVTGSIVAESEGLMQDFKTGHLIGSTPRYLTYVQLLAVPVGAAAVSYVYPLLRSTYGIGGDHGLQSPISQKWAGFAQLLSQGLSALPPGALTALVVASVLGVAFTVLEGTSYKKWTPSPTGLGIGMLVPGAAIVPMFVGAVIEFVWGRLHKTSHQRHLVPLASGFVAGEAIVAVVVPILVAAGLIALK
ncbi:MAG: OPT/YSL family transporter [Elusimicrobia bacterium]|nr:OPT/YSL family transporter [Elusimicrobiota bacterium]